MENKDGEKAKYKDMWGGGKNREMSKKICETQE
jgi:hypothetical protein